MSGGGGEQTQSLPYIEENFTSSQQDMYGNGAVFSHVDLKEYFMECWCFIHNSSYSPPCLWILFRLSPEPVFCVFLRMKEACDFPSDIF